MRNWNNIHMYVHASMYNKKKTKQSTTQQQTSTNEVNTTKYEISESVF